MPVDSALLRAPAEVFVGRLVPVCLPETLPAWRLGYSPAGPVDSVDSVAGLAGPADPAVLVGLVEPVGLVGPAGPAVLVGLVVLAGPAVGPVDPVDPVGLGLVPGAVALVAGHPSDPEHWRPSGFGLACSA